MQGALEGVGAKFKQEQGFLEPKLVRKQTCLPWLHEYGLKWQGRKLDRVWKAQREG